MKLTIKRNQDNRLVFIAKTLTGAIIDLTSKSLTFTVNTNDTTETVLITKTPTVVSAVNGVFETTLSVSDVALLTDNNYIYKYVVGTDLSYSNILLLSPFLNQSITQFLAAGTTAQRPTLSSSSYIGFRYFDTTLGVPIWWNGTTWVSDMSNIATNATNIATNATNIATNTTDLSNTYIGS